MCQSHSSVLQFQNNTFKSNLTSLSFCQFEWNSAWCLILVANRKENKTKLSLVLVLIRTSFTDLSQVLVSQILHYRLNIVICAVGGTPTMSHIKYLIIKIWTYCHVLLHSEVWLCLMWRYHVAKSIYKKWFDSCRITVEMFGWSVSVCLQRTIIRPCFYCAAGKLSWSAQAFMSGYPSNHKIIKSFYSECISLK